MNIKTAFPSKWIRATDLQGRDIQLMITEFRDAEPVAQDGSTKPVLFFQGTQKGLVLNGINGDTIATALGSEETDDWMGKCITLYPTKTDFQGKRVDCIRVRERSDALPPAATQPAAASEAAPLSVPPADDAIPF